MRRDVEVQSLDRLTPAHESWKAADARYALARDALETGCGWYTRYVPFTLAHCVASILARRGEPYETGKGYLRITKTPSQSPCQRVPERRELRRFRHCERRGNECNAEANGREHRERSR